MPISVRVERTGTPSEALSIVNCDELDPGAGQVWVEQEAIGVNYLDVMQRKGTAPLPLPNGLGLEGAGRVTKVGPGVSNVREGDRVAYILGPVGSYASGRLYPADRLISLPDTVSFEDAAAVLFKGITAQYLIKSTYPVKKGTTVLMYGAAGALGQLLVPWAKYLGATVIGVVSKEASVARARDIGCDEVLVWGSDLPERVISLTNGGRVDVIYDGVGRETFAASLDSLKPRGLLASIGASSGPPPAVEMSTLNTKGSLFVTRPGLAAHATNIAEFQERATDVFSAVVQGIIKPRIWKAFELSDVVDAHSALEDGKAAGAIVLMP
ncbi:quinone oxidoreductase family protein (plasmid) [Rhizobium leguminosarum]